MYKLTPIAKAITIWATFTVCLLGYAMAKVPETQVSPEPVIIEVPAYWEQVSIPLKETRIESAYYEIISESITEAEIDMLASITYLEAGNQPMVGKRAVVEVILNRVLSDKFPNTIESVLYQEGQFTPAAQIASTPGGEEEYTAVEQVLHCQYPILEGERLFFSTFPQKKDHIQIGDHYFC